MRRIILQPGLTLHPYTRATVLDTLEHVHPSGEHAIFQNVRRILFVSRVQYQRILGREISRLLSLRRAMLTRLSGRS